MSRKNSPMIEREFIDAKTLCKVGAAFLIFCVAPPAAVYFQSGSLGMATGAWLAGTAMFRASLTLFPGFKAWLRPNGPS